MGRVPETRRASSSSNPGTLHPAPVRLPAARPPLGGLDAGHPQRSPCLGRPGWKPGLDVRFDCEPGGRMWTAALGTRGCRATARAVRRLHCWSPSRGERALGRPRWISSRLDVRFDRKHRSLSGSLRLGRGGMCMRVCVHGSFSLVVCGRSHRLLVVLSPAGRPPLQGLPGLALPEPAAYVLFRKQRPCQRSTHPYTSRQVVAMWLWCWGLLIRSRRAWTLGGDARRQTQAPLTPTCGCQKWENPHMWGLTPRASAGAPCLLCL